MVQVSRIMAKNILQRIYPMSFAMLKKDYSLIPIVALIGLGYALAIGSSAYVFFRNPDCSRNWGKDREPWERWRHKNYHYYSNYGVWVDCTAPLYKLPGEK